MNASYKVIGYQTGEYTVGLVEGAVLTYAQEIVAPAATLTVSLVKEEVLLKFVSEYLVYAIPSQQPFSSIYRTTESTASFAVTSVNGFSLASCSFGSVASPEMEITSAVYDAALNSWNYTASFSTVQIYSFALDLSSLSCSEFYNSFSMADGETNVFSIAYDPAFVPGDVMVTRVSAHNVDQPTLRNQEFDLIVFRMVYPWNVFYVTDKSWVSESSGFLDAEQEGVLKFRPYDRIIAPGEILTWQQTPSGSDGELAYFVPVSGDFFLGAADNLFVYTASAWNTEANDNDTSITFLFGMNWFASSWVSDVATSDIVASNSRLPFQLRSSAMHVSVGSSSLPYNRPFSSIHVASFTRSTLVPYVAQKMIVSYTYWVTSRVAPYTRTSIDMMSSIMTPSVSTSLTEEGITFAVQFPYPYSANYGRVNSLISVVDAATGEAFDGVSIRKSSSVFYVVLPLPAGFSGLVKLVCSPGAFYYTASYTYADAMTATYTYYSALFTASYSHIFTPANFIQHSIVCLYENSPSCTLTLQSSVPCQWSAPQFSSAEAGSVTIADLSSQTATFSLLLKSASAVLTIPADICANANGYTFEAYEYQMTAFIPEMSSLVLSGGLANNGRINRSDALVTFRFAVPRSLIYNYATASVVSEAGAQINADVMPTVQQDSLVVKIKCNEALTKGTYYLKLASGTYSNLYGYSTNGLAVPFYFDDSNIDVESVYTLESFSSSGLHHIVLNMDESSVSYGTALPNEVFECEGACEILGYSFDPADSNKVLVSTVSGYGDFTLVVREGALLNQFGNSNARFEKAYQLDFSAPVAEVSVPSNFFNALPFVITVSFSEPVSFYNAEYAPIEASEALSQLFTVSHCLIRFGSAVDSKTFTVELYDCQVSDEIVLAVNEAATAIVGDSNNNMASLKSSVETPFPVTLHYDLAGPVVELQKTSPYITSRDFTFVATVNKACNFNAEAVTIDNGISFVVRNVAQEDNTYTVSVRFEEEPTHLSTVNVFFAEGAFTDLAGNGNLASNSLTYEVFTQGPEIRMSFGKLYTNESTETLTVSITPMDKCSNYQTFQRNVIQYNSKTASIGDCTLDTSDGTSAVFRCPVTFRVSMNPNYEDYHNMLFVVRAHFCETNIKSNEEASVAITYDIWTPVPEVSVSPAEPQHTFTVTSVYRNCVPGAEEPASYFVASLAGNRRRLLENVCSVSRELQENDVVYTAECTFDSGVVNYRFLAGAAVDFAGNEAAEYSGRVVVNGVQPISTLRFVDHPESNFATYGGSNVQIPFEVTFDKPVNNFGTHCFGYTTSSGATSWVSFSSQAASVSSNFLSGIFYLNNLAVVTDTVTFFVKENCVVDRYGNANDASVNTLKLSFMFVSSIPQWSNCTASDPFASDECNVLSTATLSGTFTRPVMDLAASNFVASQSSCSFDVALAEDALSFTVAVTCAERGLVDLRLVNIVDYLGNTNAAPAAVAHLYFAVTGPALAHTLRGEIILDGDSYVNSREFSFTIAAADCSAMSLPDGSITVSNSAITIGKLSTCEFYISGVASIDGTVSVLVADGVAQNRQGGQSAAYSFEFVVCTRRPLPDFTSSMPTVLYAPSDSQVIRVPFDVPVSINEDVTINAFGACGTATAVVESSNVLAIHFMTYARNNDCSIIVPEGFLYAPWMVAAPQLTFSYPVDFADPIVEFSIEGRSNMFVNRNFNLVCSAAEPVVWNERNIQTEGCAVSLVSSTVDAANRLVLSYTVDADVSECEITFYANAGLAVDRVTRFNSASSFVVGYKVESLHYDIEIPAEYVKTQEVDVIVTYPASVALAASNIAVDKAGCSVADFEVLAEGRARVTLAFSVENAYTLSVVNAADKYGNEAAPVKPSYVVHYDITSPMVSRPVQTFFLSNISDESTPKSVVATLEFNKNVRLTTSFEESYTLSEGFSEFVTIDSHSMTDRQLQITFSAVRGTGLHAVEFALVPSAYIDLAGNVLSSDVRLTLSVNNALPEAAITLNGGSTFIALPVTIITTFSEPISRVDTSVPLASKYTVTLGSTALLCTETSGNAFQVTKYVMSCGADVELGSETSIRVVLAAGSIVDNYNNANPVAEFEAQRSANQYIVNASVEPASDRVYVNSEEFVITTERALWKLDNSKVVCTGSVSCGNDYSIAGNQLTYRVTATAQGPFTITFQPGSLYTSDGATFESSYVIAHTYDSLPPVVTFSTAKTNYLNEVVRIACAFNKPVVGLGQDTFTFQLTVSGAAEAPASVTVVEQTDKSIVFDVLPRSSQEPFSGVLSVAVNSDNCRDTASNQCTAKRHTVVVDSLAPVATLSFSSSYVGNGNGSNAHVDLLVSFNEAVTGELSQSSIRLASVSGACAVVAAPVQSTVVSNAFVYGIDFSGCGDNTSFDVQYRLVANVVSDLSGNQNVEALSGSLSYSSLPLTARVTLGQSILPPSTITFAIAFSDPVEPLTDASIAVSPASSVLVSGSEKDYTVVAILDCAGSCPVELQLTSAIRSVYGYAYAETTQAFNVLLPPVVTLTTNPAGNINTRRFDVRVNVNQPVKSIQCSMFAQEGLSAVEGTQTVFENAKEAVCAFVSAQDRAEFTFVVPANSLENVEGATNPSDVSVSVSIDAVKPVVTLSSQWSLGDSTLDVPVVVASTKGTALSLSYLSFENCRVVPNSVEMNGEHELAFRVDVLQPELDYARVLFNAKRVHDSHGNWNDESELVLRMNPSKPALVKLYYDANKSGKVTLSFSKSVVSCGGQIQFVPADESKPTYVMNTNDAAVEILSSIAVVRPVLYAATTYTVAFTEDAFCDLSHDYAEYASCANCQFDTPYGVPTPPTSVEFTAVTATSVTLTYAGIQQYSGNEDLKMTHLVVYLYPASPVDHLRYLTSKLEDTLTIEGLEPATAYELTFFVECNKGTSLPSANFHFSTLATALETPAHFRIDRVMPVESGYDVVLAWSALPVSVPVQYVVRNGETDLCETAETSCVVPHYADLESKLFSLRAAAAGQWSEPATLEGPASVEPQAPLPVPDFAVTRKSYKDTYATWSAPATRFAPVESYFLNYARVVDEVQGVYVWTNITLPASALSYSFEETDGKLRYALIQANSRVNGELVSSTPSVATFYLGPAHVELAAHAGDTFVSLSITSDLHVVGTCSISSASKTVDSQTIDVSGNGGCLFVDLAPSTSYTIECRAYDDTLYPAAPIAAVAVVTEAFVEPAIESFTVEPAAYFVKASLQLSVPAKASCVAVDADRAAIVSKAYIVANGFANYGYPGTAANVVIANLFPSTTYSVKCVITPLSTNYERFKSVLKGRRLLDNTETQVVEVQTTESYAPAIVSAEVEGGEFRASLAPKITLRSEMPLTAYRGNFVLRTSDGEVVQTIPVTSGAVSISDRAVVISVPAALQPATHYTLGLDSTGALLDKAIGAPLARQDSLLAFLTTSDTGAIEVPVIVNVAPEEGETAALSAGLYLTFENSIVLGEGSISISLNDTSIIEYKVKELGSVSVDSNVFIFKPEIVYPSYTEVVITLGEGAICSTGGYCLPSRSFSYVTSSHTERPTLISVYPAVNEAVPASTNIVLTFNKVMAIRSNAVFTFIDEEKNAIQYNAQSDVPLGNIVLQNNVITIKPVRLAAGHKYTLVVRAGDVTDSEGNEVWPVISNLSFEFDEYECGGEYIAKYIDEHCECFTTETKCECWCGKNVSSNVVLRQLFDE